MMASFSRFFIIGGFRLDLGHQAILGNFVLA
jgi:hypothetical protein